MIKSHAVNEHNRYTTFPIMTFSASILWYRDYLQATRFRVFLNSLFRLNFVLFYCVICKYSSTIKNRLIFIAFFFKCLSRIQVKWFSIAAKVISCVSRLWRIEHEQCVIQAAHILCLGLYVNFVSNFNVIQMLYII